MDLGILRNRAERSTNEERARERNEKKFETYQARRREKQERRRAPRVKPYHELAGQNREIVGRAKALVEADPDAQPVNRYGSNSVKGEVPSSSLVILGPGEGSETTLAVMISVYRTSDVDSMDAYDSDARAKLERQRAQTGREHIDFGFFQVDDKRLKDIQSNHGSAPGFRHAPDENMGHERTYKVKSGSDSEDGIVEMGTSSSPTKIFSPLSAIERAVETRGISAHLDSLDSTINMIEEAARNPELNPSLAHSLAVGEAPSQQVA